MLLTPEEYASAKAKDNKRSGFSAPMIISDGMESTLNHADGKRYTSKSEYYRAVKQAGCEVVGNEPSFKRPKAKEYDAGDVKGDIKRAFDQVSSK
jgi:hypothetical protein